MERQLIRERFAVVFRVRGRKLAGALEVDDERLMLHGRADGEAVEFEIPRADLSAVRIGRGRGERLNGYPTLLLERPGEPDVQIAPLGAARLAEIAAVLRA
jgi:hypothetical protein